MEMICPVMSRGWLSNKYASKCGPMSNTFGQDNLCPCYKEKCGMWDKLNGRCGYIVRK